MAYTYGSGTATQFTDGTQRQVLELGPEIHYFNPSVTPILTVSGRLGVNGTPVPIYEWMEDEYFIKRSIIIAAADMVAETDILDSASAGINGDGCVLRLQRQAQMEMFEVGGVYTISGSSGQGESNTHFMVHAIGQNVNHGSKTDRDVQFVGGTYSAGVWTLNDVANGVDMITAAQETTITFVGTVSGAGGTSGKYPWEGGTDGNSFTTTETFAVRGIEGIAEGAAIGKESRKKVRRLSNCTQIFREPYEITRTAKVSKQYGGPELARLQARKLAQIKVNVEYAMLFNGAKSLDSTSSNPKRQFQGLGVGSAAGTIQSNNGYDNTAMQLADSNGTLNQFDALIENIFQDTVDGSMTKTVYASNKWLVKLAKMVRADASTQLSSMQGEGTKAGLRVVSYMGPVGQLDFVPHPLLKGGYEDYAVAIDDANFNVRVLSESGFQLRKDVVKDGSDGQTDEWLVECGPEARQEQTHAVLKLT